MLAREIATGRESDYRRFCVHMEQHSREYEAYIHSLEWYVVKERAIKAARGRCQRCGAKRDLQVHHLTYERLGHELPQDLSVLCPDCHEAADRKRRADQEERHYDNRLNAWATKRYGEEWWLYVDEGQASEEFELWLERQW